MKFCSVFLLTIEEKKDNSRAEHYRKEKNAELVYKALEGTKVNLKKIKIFHSDRGSEFNNHVIDETLIPLEYQGL